MRKTQGVQAKALEKIAVLVMHANDTDGRQRAGRFYVDLNFSKHSLSQYALVGALQNQQNIDGTRYSFTCSANLNRAEVIASSTLKKAHVIVCLDEASLLKAIRSNENSDVCVASYGFEHSHKAVVHLGIDRTGAASEKRAGAICRAIKACVSGPSVRLAAPRSQAQQLLSASTVVGQAARGNANRQRLQQRSGLPTLPAALEHAPMRCVVQ